MARTSDMGLRREPHPPMPTVIPSASSATTSSSVVRLSATLSAAALVDERLPGLVGDVRQVELEGEALLEAVAALHVDGVDAVQRLLGPTDDRGVLRCDLGRHLTGGGAQLARWHDVEHRAEVVQLLCGCIRDGVRHGPLLVM